jgi:C-terminal processing protease CtpA/Prc
VMVSSEPPRHLDLPAAPPTATAGGVLVLTVRSLPAGPEWNAAKPKIVEAIAAARAVVVDLRVSPDDPAAWRAWSAFDQIDDELAPRAVSSPARRQRVWDGFPPQVGGTSGGYQTGLLLTPGKVFTPGKPTQGRRVVFVAGPNDELDEIALALLAAGEACLLGHGGVPLAGSVTPFPIRPGLVLRLGGVDTGLDLKPDLVVPAGEDPIAAARRMAGRAARPVAARPAAAPAIRPENAYPEMKGPSLEYRLLALFRYWNTIEYFYPYKHLIPDWGPVLADEIPQFEAATTAKAYAGAVQRLLTRVPDGHSSCYGHPDLVRWNASVPVEVRLVEGNPVVTRIFDAAGAPGIAVGDIIVSVDGEPVPTRMLRLRDVLSGSTEISRGQRAAAMLLAGPADAPVEILLQGATGGPRTVKLPRTEKRTPGEGPSYKLLAPDVGYVDMTRLTPPEVDEMFKVFAATKGIVFDMRGYPKGTAWPIAPYLNVKEAKVAAAFRRATYVGPPNPDGRTFTAFEQPLPSGDKPLYRGSTVMLIDDRAISQSEHTGLFFEAATDIRFVGTPSAGANGDVTSLVLPGGITALFTGHDVRHADGRQLQRIGLRPHLKVEPTLAGVRAGKDEVLDRGVEVVRELAAKRKDGRAAWRPAPWASRGAASGGRPPTPRLNTD